MICGKKGRDCASRRVHSVAELQERTGQILRGYFAKKDARRAAGEAVGALLTEVCTMPKPGLVDRTNSGSHRDMDIFTFIDAAALARFDEEMTRRNLSPGGCADLLAIAYFLHALSCG